MTRIANPLLEIDLASIAENYRILAGAARGARPAAVVKCDAYGLGAGPVARMLHRREGCRDFFVAYAEEGESLRKVLGGEPRIFVFNGPFTETLPLHRGAMLTPVLNSLEQAWLWANNAPGAQAALHLDTGMNRLGLAPGEIAAFKDIGGLAITHVMSHLACASDPDHAMNARQLAAFLKSAAEFPGAEKSISSSGGALLSKPFALDVVRLGIGLYGVCPFGSPGAEIRPVARLTAPVIQLRRISARESVGYGAAWIANRDSLLATIALGYGDGFPRAGSNRAKAWLGAAVCPIIGRISMDLTILDATDAPDPIAVGERAELFGPRIAIEEAAASCGTLGYELLTNIGGLARGLGGRLSRRYLWNGAPADDDLNGA